jgi:hypothetical protein
MPLPFSSAAPRLRVRHFQLGNDRGRCNAGDAVLVRGQIQMGKGPQAPAPSVNHTVVPLPSVLSIHTRPPWRSTSLCTMVSPAPEPPP